MTDSTVFYKKAAASKPKPRPVSARTELEDSVCIVTRAYVALEVGATSAESRVVGLPCLPWWREMEGGHLLGCPDLVLVSHR